jgi:hypothetical protein
MAQDTSLLLRPVLTIETGTATYQAHATIWDSPSDVKEHGLDAFHWSAWEGKSLPPKLGNDKSTWRASVSLELNDGRLVEWWRGAERFAGPLYHRGVNYKVVNFTGNLDVCVSHDNHVVGLEIWHADRATLNADLKVLLEAMMSVEQARERKRKAQEALDVHWPHQRRRLEDELQQLAAKEAETRRWLTQGEADTEEAEARERLAAIAGPM